MSLLLVALILVFASIQQNYRLMFVDYPQRFNDSAGNTSELGAVIKQFTDTIGTPDSAWVVGYPYWLDTRLVGLQAGFGLRDLAIWPEQFDSTLEVPGPKLFLLNTEDVEDLDRLKNHVSYRQCQELCFENAWQGFYCYADAT